MSKNCDVIAIFPIYSQFGAIRKPGSGPTVCKTLIFNIFINSNLLSYKKWKQNYKIDNTAPHTIALSKGTILAKKRWFFANKMLTLEKLRGPWY